MKKKKKQYQESNLQHNKLNRANRCLRMLTNDKRPFCFLNPLVNKKKHILTSFTVLQSIKKYIN
jgi:hypothetical protein